VDRLRFIQGCQRLGLRLRDIADLLAVRDTGACPCEPAEQLLRRRLGDIDAELARLTTLRAEMTAMLGALTSAECQPPTPGSWCPPANGKPATGMPATGRPATGREVTTMSDPIRLSCCCEDPDCPPTDCGCDC